MFDLINVALAQNAVPSAAVPTEAVDWMFDAACSNPATTKWILGAVLLYLSNTGISAWMKSRGITKDSPWIGTIAKYMRLVAGDVKPPDATVVKTSAAIMADPVKAAPVIEELHKDPEAKQLVINAALATEPLNKAA